jgi:hypothetical protein
MITNNNKEFLSKLADLCEQHKAEFSYTSSDDGIHITLAGKEVFRGWLFESSAAGELRAVCDRADNRG